MAFFDRATSAPSLVDVDEREMVIRTFSSEFSDDQVSITSELAQVTDTVIMRPRELCSLSWSESEQSPVNMRKAELRPKKRRAPPPPSGPPPPYPSPGSLRHSYTFSHRHHTLSTHSNRTSTDSESLLTFESSRNIFQSSTSTDSENVSESTNSGGNFLTTPDSDQCPSPTMHQLGLPSPLVSPRTDKSRLQALKDALRSPMNLRKNSKREHKENKEDECGGVTFRVKKNAVIEPPDNSVWTEALVPDDLWEMDTEFEIKRIPEYDKYLNELLDETDTNHPDYDDLVKAADKVKNMVREREEEVREAENDQRMETVQERFPYDDLQLQDKANKTLSLPKSRGLSLRRRSAPSAVVFRSLSGNRSRSSSALWAQGAMGRKDGDTFTTIRQAADSTRQYVMEGPVQFAMGMQTQDRYIFLFSDLLLVAKQKNATTFKLKVRVPLCDVWLATCVDEVTELTRPLDRSFVIGWPTCNVAATFKEAATKEKWLTKLSESVQAEKERVEPKEIGLKVVLRDDNKSEGCQLTVGNTQQAKDVLQDCCTQLSIPEADSKDYKLWVWYGKEGSPYPLIGHETPFSIKLSQLREIARTRGDDNMTLTELNSVIGDEPSNNKCEFILKQKKSPKHHSQDETSHKMKKSKKASPLMHLFKRGRDVSERRRDDKNNNNDDNSGPQGKLFGHPLSSQVDSDYNPPKILMDILAIMFRDGPHTVGILRKPGNVKQTRETKERLDQGEDLPEGCSVMLAGSLLKAYLKALPDPLLMEELHVEWFKLPKITDDAEKLAHVRNLLSKMPMCNINLLKHLLCVLHHIQEGVAFNKMNSFNLSVCIAPSLLYHNNPADVSLGAPAVEFMIDHCAELFGPGVLLLFGEPAPVNTTRQDSETDSDSIHSMLSVPESANGQLRQDDSSIDSLVEREMEGEEDGGREGGESSPQLPQSHLSTSNLSYDSGLTLSDNQLYDSTDHDSTDPCDARGGSGSGGAKGYHHSHTASAHYHDRDECEMDSYHLGGGAGGSHHNTAHSSSGTATSNPIPPPRKRRHGVGEGGGDHAGRLDSGDGRGGPLRGRDKRHTLHTSASSSRLLDSCPSPSHSLSATLPADGSFRPLLSHPTFSTQLSEDPPLDHHHHHHHNHHHHHRHPELPEYRKPVDMGVLRKSASGAHLILDDETSLPSRKLSEAGIINNKNVGSGGGIMIGGVMHRQQSSGVDSTPPHSPQSKYSYSSRDSAISDSSYGAGSTRENSIASPPQTPDDDDNSDHAYRLPPWLPAVQAEPTDGSGLGGGLDPRLAMSLNITVPQHQHGLGGSQQQQQNRLSASHSAAQLRSVQNVRYLVSPPASPVYEMERPEFSLTGERTSHQDHAFQPPHHALWPGRSHEAEDITMKGGAGLSSSPQIQVTQCSSSSDEKLDGGHSDDDEDDHSIAEDDEEDDTTPRPSPNKAGAAAAVEIPLALSHGSSSNYAARHHLMMSKLAHSSGVAKGSPPSKVLLRSLRSPRSSGKDSASSPAPVRASHDSDILAQIQRGGGVMNLRDAGAGDGSDVGGLTPPSAQQGFSPPSESQAFNAARSMESINDAEYINVKPRLTIIRREESMHSNVSSYSSGSGSSLGKDSLSQVSMSSSPTSVQSTSSSSSGASSVVAMASGGVGMGERPSRPPDYDEALQRQAMIQRDLLLERIKQKESTAKAKMLYDESLKKALTDYKNPDDLRYFESQQALQQQEQQQEQRAVEDQVHGNSQQQQQETGHCMYEESLPEDYDYLNHSRNMARARQMYYESLAQYNQRAEDPKTDNIHQRDSQAASSQETGSQPRAVEAASSDNSSLESKHATQVTLRQRPASKSVHESRTRQRFMELSETRTSVTRSTAARPKSLLDTPSSSFSLHRSHSDSSDLGKLGQQQGGSSPRSRSKFTKDSDDKSSEQQQQQQQHSDNSYFRYSNSGGGEARECGTASGEYRSSVANNHKPGDSLQKGPTRVRDQTFAASGTGGESAKSGYEHKDLLVPESPRRKISEPTVSGLRRDRFDPSAPHHLFPATGSCFYRPEDSPRNGKNSPSSSSSPRSQSPRPDGAAAEISHRFSKVDSNVAAAVSAFSRVSGGQNSGATKTPSVVDTSNSTSVKSSRVDSHSSSLHSSSSPLKRGGGADRTPVRKSSAPVGDNSRQNARSESPVTRSSGSTHPSDGRVSRGFAGVSVGRSNSASGRSGSFSASTSSPQRNTASSTAGSAAAAASTSSSTTTSSSSSASSSAGGKGKSELGWSVKSLRQLYNADGAVRTSLDSPQPSRADSPRARSGSASAGSRPAPPPYQDPPPFRRLQDGSRQSTSSNSSNGSSGGGAGRSSSPGSNARTGSSATTTSSTYSSSSRRLGPQNWSGDSSSSAEELAFYNSRWSRARSESGSGHSDQEATNAYTDISYV